MDEEASYLARYPDVAEAIRTGAVVSALDHYLTRGRREGRTWLTEPARGRPIVVGSGAPRAPEPRAALPGLQHNCEAAFLAPGYLLLRGWIADRADPIVALAVVGAGGAIARGAVHRNRRLDVEAHLSASIPFEAGYWSLLEIPKVAAGALPRLALCFASGGTMLLTPAKITWLGQRELLAAFLAFFAERGVLGSALARSFVELGDGLAATIARLHKAIRETYRATSDGRYGPDVHPLVSFVCCLHGIPDFLFLQVARFAEFNALGQCEFIYVNNSPELEETLHRDAEIAAYLFETSIRVISLDQNTGFSYASNLGIARSRGRTIVVINPDVFPRSRASVHTVFSLAEDEGTGVLFGGKLFYADGSVMHEGMYCCVDRELSILAKNPVCTVEHRSKGFGASPDATRESVAAVSGALMVANRSVWQKTGGFDEDFIYGHYEDADLCLHLRKSGGTVLYEPNLAFWHYEGMGSTHRPEHQGAAQYNRWLFSRRWAEQIPAETAP